MMTGASNNPGPGPGPNNSSMPQQPNPMSSAAMSRGSPGQGSGPGGGPGPGDNPAMAGAAPPGLNPRLAQNMGNMPPNMPMEAQRGSPGLPPGTEKI